MSEISEARHEIIYGNSEEWKKDHLNYYTKLICFEAKLKSANRIKQLEDAISRISCADGCDYCDANYEILKALEQK